MNILVLGGTRFFGVHMVKELLEMGHQVTIGTRGLTLDSFGDRVNRVKLDHTNIDSMKDAFKGLHFDVVIDKVAYCSNDIKYAMESVSCDKYIYMSSTAIYELDHNDVREDEFDGFAGELVWCNRPDYSYSEVKRQAEYALWQKYGDRQWIAVKGNPMYIDNMDSQMSFIKSDEAGKFMAYLVDKDFTGPINGCSYGTISIREILEYVEKKTGKQAVITDTGEVAPYNGTMSHSVNLDKAAGLGYEFSDIKEWMYELIDRCIELVKN